MAYNRLGTKAAIQAYHLTDFASREPSSRRALLPSTLAGTEPSIRQQIPLPFATAPTTELRYLRCRAETAIPPSSDANGIQRPTSDAADLLCGKYTCVLRPQPAV
jgi:hypothetical protein